MNIESDIKKILKDNFKFNGSNDDMIFNHLDSVKYFKYLLLLEDHFKISLDKKDISTINKTLKEINEIYKI